MTPAQTLNWVQLIKWECMSHVIIVSPVEHSSRLLLQQQSFGVRERPVVQTGDVENLRDILRRLLLQVGQEEHEMRQNVPDQVTSRCHDPDPVEGTPPPVKVQHVGHQDEYKAVLLCVYSHCRYVSLMCTYIINMYCCTS